MDTMKDSTLLSTLSGDLQDSMTSDDVSLVVSRKRIPKMYFAAVASLLSSLSAGFLSSYSASATYDMTTNPESPVSPTQDEVTWIGSVVSFGIMFGSIYAGPLADKIGRKDTIILNVIPLLTGWLFICFATNVTVIIVGRVFCGFACGVTMVAVPMYCVEIARSDVRGLLGSGGHGFVVIGNLLSGLIGYFVTWQNLALVGAFFAALAFFCFLPMPESPRFLLARGRLTRAIEVMQELHGNNLEAVEECTAIHKGMQQQHRGRLSLKEFKHPTVYKPALIAIGVISFQHFSGMMAIFSYSSYIFESSKSFLDPKISTIIIGAVQLMITIPSNCLVDKAGRKLMLITSGVLEALTLYALGTYYYMSSNSKEFQDTYSWIPLSSLTLYVIAYSTGYGPIPGFLAQEIVPTRARSTVSGIAMFMAGVFYFIVTKSFSILEDNIGNYGTFWLYGTLAVTGVIYVSIIVPETKGKKLEDIARIFDKSQAKEEKVNE